MKNGNLEKESNHTCPILRTYIQTWQKQVEFRVIITNDMTVFTNENLYVNSKFNKEAIWLYAELFLVIMVVHVMVSGD